MMTKEKPNAPIALSTRIDGASIFKLLMAILIAYSGYHLASSIGQIGGEQRLHANVLILISVLILGFSFNLALNAVFGLNLASLARLAWYAHRATPADMENALQQAKRRGFDGLDWYGFLNDDHRANTFRYGITKKALADALYRMNLAADMKAIHEGELDENGYPTHFTLNRISGWAQDDYLALMAFIESIWCEAGKLAKTRGNNECIYDLDTGNWTGNKDIVAALRENWLFWSTCWLTSHRDGWHRFILPVSALDAKPFLVADKD